MSTESNKANLGRPHENSKPDCCLFFLFFACFTMLALLCGTVVLFVHIKIFTTLRLVPFRLRRRRRPLKIRTRCAVKAVPIA